MASKGEKHSPLEQFEIVPYTQTEIGAYNISFTNSSLVTGAIIASVLIF